jgi:membrane-associated HD superfamily phosphohydrolase
MMALMNPAGGISEIYVVTELRALGVQDSTHHIINLSNYAHKFWERFAVAWQIGLCVLLILLSICCLLWIRIQIPVYKSYLQRIYLREFPVRHFADFIMLMGAVLFIAGSIVAIMYLTLGILEVLLVWGDMPAITAEISGDFARQTTWLRERHTLGLTLFAGYFVALAAMLISFIRYIWLQASEYIYEQDTHQGGGYDVTYY